MLESNLAERLSRIGANWWEVPLRVIAIAVAAWITVALLQRAIRQLRTRISRHIDDHEAVMRAETVGRVLRYVVAVVVFLVAGMLILGEFGISVAPILGAAGVAGIAIGFGAQSLVKDYFNGMFLLLEDQFHQGDVLTIAGHTGVVEEVTLRYVRLRDYDGNVHFVPNGQITDVVNMGRGFSNAVVEIGVGYGVDLDHAMAVMRRTAQELQADPAYDAKIAGEFELAGVDRWDDSAVVIKGRMKVRPLEQWGVKREYLRRLKIAFDAAGIEIPFPQMTIHRAQEAATE